MPVDNVVTTSLGTITDPEDPEDPEARGLESDAMRTVDDDSMEENTSL